MAELSTLARPYAKAAFEYALGEGRTGQWSSMVAAAAAVSQQHKVADMLASPAATSEQIAATFCGLCGDVLDDGGRNFIQVLAGVKRLSLLPQISEQFDVLLAQQQQFVDVQLSSAFDLDEAQQREIADKLRKSLNKDINIHTVVDRNLIGGVVIRAGDLVIDGSVRGKLAKLAEAMNQ